MTSAAISKRLDILVELYEVARALESATLIEKASQDRPELERRGDVGTSES